MQRSEDMAYNDTFTIHTQLFLVYTPFTLNSIKNKPIYKIETRLKLVHYKIKIRINYVMSLTDRDKLK